MDVLYETLVDGELVGSEPSLRAAVSLASGLAIGCQGLVTVQRNEGDDAITVWAQHGRGIDPETEGF